MRRKFRAIAWGVSFHSLFKRNLSGVIKKKYKNAHLYFNKDLEKILHDMAEKNKIILEPIIMKIALEEELLDFTRSCELDDEKKVENYHKCTDYALDILSTMIEETLAHLENNSFINFLCKIIFKIFF